MKIKNGQVYPFKIKKMLDFHGMRKGYFIRLVLKGMYSPFLREHLKEEFLERLTDSGFRFVTLDEAWFNRNKKNRKSILVQGVWCDTEEDLNLYRLMFGIEKDYFIYEF